MSTNIRPIAGKGIVTQQDAGAGSAVVNHWGQVVSVAQPAFDAIVKLQPARDWLKEEQRKYRITVLIDLDPAVEKLWDEEAKARLAIIPEIGALQEAAKLFDDAVHRSAPEAWFHLAIGAMLHGRPNAKNVSPGYTCEVVDMLIYDHEAQERGCQPGFSPPIFISALRKTRRESDFVPSAAAILKECKHYRKQFKDLADDVETLITIRENAEQVVNAVELALKESDNKWTDDDEREFQRKKAAGLLKKYVHDGDDSDVPF